MEESTCCLWVWSKSLSIGSVKVSWRKSAIMLETICGSLVSWPSSILSVVGRELFFLDESMELIAFHSLLSDGERLFKLEQKDCHFVCLYFVISCLTLAWSWLYFVRLSAVCDFNAVRAAFLFSFMRSLMCGGRI